MSGGVILQNFLFAVEFMKMADAGADAKTDNP